MICNTLLDLVPLVQYVLIDQYVLPQVLGSFLVFLVLGSASYVKHVKNVSVLASVNFLVIYCLFYVSRCYILAGLHSVQPIILFSFN